MTLKLYNSLSKKKEDLKPLKNKIKMYSCGPTVYDNPHIGNFRSFVFFDLLKKYLNFLNFDVQHVMNVTDIDDKIINKCCGKIKNLELMTKKYFESFKNDANKLKIDLPNQVPFATDHIDEMINLIEKLILKGHAYKTEDGSVFFKIDSFKNYGMLSKIDFSQLSKTDRIKNDEYDKNSINDFALWKSRKVNDGDIFWNSPWGNGRPGWHIECSAMSLKYLGAQFDIHCGGIDLLFPHHENEIAQSVCATNKTFAKLWVHCEHLLINGSKMSKSLNNFYTLNDIIKKGYNVNTIRFFLISSSYSHKIDLNDVNLNSSNSALKRIQDFYNRIFELSKGDVEIDDNKIMNTQLIVDFKIAMNDNLNMSKALSVIFNYIKKINIKLDKKQMTYKESILTLAALNKIDEVLGVIRSSEIKLSKNDKKLIEERNLARKNKNWDRADEIRLFFKKKGIDIDDSEAGIIIK
ncbi:MAG: cysteine--tRNA ligase [Candidatus Marinimicrobia bacterium]|nr:cysteine--tRNA ligase [Candidatus Neomarinimicrobiota bacterium]OUW50648.1 MAG: cysteine--tRNA ligase [bacterium TMED190]